MQANPALSIRDPIHGFIRADRLEKALIDSRPLQRLRSIRQLGFAHLVFPGAEHSRFSHVLGAMHLAGRVYDALALHSDGLLDPDRRSRERRLVRVAALVHDVLLTLGFFSVLQIPFDLAVLAAMLAVIGYSLNDTIVVFDRIRENFRRVRKEGAEELMNTSVNQMLGRTVITSFTTLLVLLALLFLGGEAVRGFSIALIVGVVVG